VRTNRAGANEWHPPFSFPAYEKLLLPPASPSCSPQRRSARPFGAVPRGTQGVSRRADLPSRAALPADGRDTLSTATSVTLVFVRRPAAMPAGPPVAPLGSCLAGASVVAHGEEEDARMSVSMAELARSLARSRARARADAFVCAAGRRELAARAHLS